MPSYFVDLASGRVSPETQSWSDEHLVSTIPLDRPAGFYFLVYVDYTTGNSFGRDPETYHELVDAYRTEAEAVAVAQSIRAHETRTRGARIDFDERHKPTLRMGNGAEVTQHQPWLGHFERLVAVHVLPISLTAPPAVELLTLRPARKI